MLQIRFDEVDINEDNIFGVKQKGVMFDDNFTLGTTVAREFEFTVALTGAPPLVVQISEDGTNWLKLYVNDVEVDTNNVATIKAMDGLAWASSVVPSVVDTPKSYHEIWVICWAELGITAHSSTLPYGDIIVETFNNWGYNVREWLSFLSEINGGYCYVGNDNKGYLGKYTNDPSVKEILVDECEQLVVGDHHTMSRVVYDNGVLKFESGLGNTLYLNGKNPLIDTQEVFDNIVANIQGFNFHNLSTGQTTVDETTRMGEVFKVVSGGNTYYSITQFDSIEYFGGWIGELDFSISTFAEQETKITGINSQFQRIEVEIDRTENKVEIMATDVSIQQDVNNELRESIQANTAKIELTDQNITTSVNNLTGALTETINSVENELQDQLTALRQQLAYAESTIEQLAQSITSTIKTTGGNNLLRNSVGLGGLDYWTVTGTVQSVQDNYTEQNTVSGSKFLTSVASTMRQSYSTLIGTTYGISFKLRHIINGTANAVTIRIHKTPSEYLDVLTTAEQTAEYNYFQTFNTVTYVASTSTPYIEIINTGDDTIEISDLIISTGDNQEWTGYVDEVYGKEHRLDKYGLQLKDLASGNTSTVTSTTMEMKQNGTVVAEVSKDRVYSEQGIFEEKLQIGRLQIVVLDANNVVEYV